MADWVDICADMSQDSSVKTLWENYRSNNSYAEATSLEDVLKAVKEVGRRLSEI